MGWDQGGDQFATCHGFPRHTVGSSVSKSQCFYQFELDVMCCSFLFCCSYFMFDRLSAQSFFRLTTFIMLPRLWYEL